MTTTELATAISKLENWRAYSVVTLFHPEAIALRRERDALTARVAELRRFAVGILDLCPHTECEGIQELAVNHGVLVEVTVTEPCGDNCECAEVSDFPLTCYRLAPEFADGEKQR